MNQRREKGRVIQLLQYLTSQGVLSNHFPLISAGRVLESRTVSQESWSSTTASICWGNSFAHLCSHWHSLSSI